MSEMWKGHRSHYDWLDEHLVGFLLAAGVAKHHADEGIISAHGDKGYSYKHMWQDAGIHFYHGMALYLLLRCPPYYGEVWDNGHLKQNPGDWVAANYERFRKLLPELAAEDLNPENVS